MSQMHLTGTPQTEGISGSNQQQNNAGGFTWVVDDITRLRRFICLGSEGGNYYTKEAELKAQNAQAILRLIESGKGVEVVTEIVNFSLAGRTAKQDPIIFALALCAHSEDRGTKLAAHAAIPKICRIPTFLFAFVEFMEKLDPESSGWGRAMRTSIANWYLEKGGKDLAFAVTKYKQRKGWSHKDLLRLSHPRTQDEAHQLVFRYITKGPEVLNNYQVQQQQEQQQQQPERSGKRASSPNDEEVKETLEFLKIVEQVSKMVGEEDSAKLCELIRHFKLGREHLPTQQLNNVEIWEALLEEMPMTAMLRNLAKMTSIGLLQDESRHTKNVVDRLLNPDQLKRARIHPFNILLALKTYNSGKGEKGKLSWNPVAAISKALDEAFYLAFKFVEPTGQRVVVGLDVSGSMRFCKAIGSEVLNCHEAAMAMSLVMARTEPACHMMAFSNNFTPLENVSASKTLEENLKAIEDLPFDGTDCSLPMVWALKNKIQADVFIVYTDNETYSGKVHPCEALVQYRKEMKIPQAKLIVVGMAVNEFTIADPNDPGMMDIAGFDANAPEIMRNFMLGYI